MDKYILYGMTGSLYTGKVRAYMRQNHVPFVEYKSGSTRFNEQVVPKIERWTIPVVEAPDGTLMQDGTFILDQFEAMGTSEVSIFPDTSEMRALAHLFELFGGEGMMRPAMHYRWSFDDQNLSALRDTFRDTLPDGLTEEEREKAFIHASGRMRKVAVAFGLTPDLHTAIEQSYEDFLARFNAHLEDTPFLLGGHATVGDYGLFGPLYAHLGRDPKPLNLMQTAAPRVFRWAERMNMPERLFDEPAVRTGPDLFAFDALPATLKSLMAYIAEEYLPEITAHVAYANRWLAEGQERDPRKWGLGRGIGMADFEWRGQEISTVVTPYRFFMLQRLTDCVAAASAPAQAAIRALFAETGLESILDLRTSRRVERKGHLEVWAD